jgi:predicted nucleic acid-binding protein
MRIYVDGSALSRYLPDVPESAAWLGWVHGREQDLLTTPLALSELRQVAQTMDPAARQTAHAVGDRLEVVRFSDQTLRTAAMASTVLSPFAALHLGVAAAHPDVTTIATYDPLLARVAVIHGLAVLTPGRPERWWAEP